MKICTFNVLNLFLNLDKYDGQDLNTMTEAEWATLSPGFGDVPRNKSLFELTGLATAIKDINADVFIMPEIGGKHSLKLFNKHFLDSQYKCVVLEENSNRGIFVGYLVKKDYRYEVRSYSEERILVKGESKRLSRNLNLVSLYKDDKELCHVIGVHLKSQRNDENSRDIDFMDVRQAELEKIVEIYQRVSAEFSSPVFIGGDFNFDLMDSTRQESKILESCDLKDIHQIKNSTDIQRTTFVYFQSRASLVIKQQLDFILFSSKFEDRINKEASGTYYYKNEYGDSLGLPENRFEKQLMPSDHFPLVLEFSLENK